MDLRDHRKIYTKFELLENTVDSNPIQQFRVWFSDAVNSTIIEANTMTLATATADGKPSARIVLLKEVNDEGFVFFSNYLSRKGGEIALNPNAQLLFFWDILERQVRIEGVIEKISKEKSIDYFNSRPAESKAGAIASPQSQIVPNRKFLEDRLEEVSQQELVMPEHWGGYMLKPSYFEFWQGRQYRLHDRIIYTLGNGGWTIGRLAP
jgi:pyridoxamine 5'-phosphate oxidase